MNRLKELRKKKNLSQGQVAHKVGLSRQAISLYERNKRWPEIANLTKLANFFNVPLSYLMGEEKCPYCSFIEAGYYDYDKKDPDSAKMQGIKWIDEHAVLCILNDGSFGIWREDQDGFYWRPIRVTHCPMCGRKLG